MRKRGIIQLGGVEPKIRISKPGVDVDLAGPTDFLLHESHLYSQPYHFSFVACPFAGYTGNASRAATVNVSIPNVTDDPVVLLWPVDSTGATVSPMSRTTGTGSSGSGFNCENWDVNFDLISSTQIDINFGKGSDTRLSPDGCYLILLRKPI